MSQPEWVFKKWPQYSNKSTIAILKDLKDLTRDAEFNELKKYQLTGGLLLGEWIRQLRQIIDQSAETAPLKMVLYSAVGN